MNRRARFRSVAAPFLLIGLVNIPIGPAAGQSEKTPSPLGVEGIKRVLTSHKQWTLYWDLAAVGRPRIGSRTSDRSSSATLEFMRVGPRVVAHEDDPVHHLECEFDVVVTENGFTLARCVGWETTLTHDPADRDYPFKGRTHSMLLWLAPSK
jgi:hypothetical protein